MVPVKALFGQVKEIVGELAWDGEAHVLRALSSSAKVTINDKKAAQQRLSPGDKVRIARSEFVYEVVEE
jgi:pSer/pThr/pTyr-binding forkhead associated (FHA) protein